MKIFQTMVALLCLMLVACSNNRAEAPVVEGWQGHDSAEISDYRVQPGDTIYSVAWGFGMDYHDIARYNHLSEPYHLTPGQTLRMSGASAQSYAAPATPIPVASPVPIMASGPVSSAVITTTQTSSVTSTTNQVNKSVPTAAATTTVVTATKTTEAGWQWPTQGSVIHGYSATPGGNRGIDIAGKLNQPVVASAGGKVVYAGSGMAGYGNLIIIKHNDTDLSAYAYNKKLYVKEGDKVAAGQRIAAMGKSDAGQVSLHFEIRRNGKPIDPMTCLPHTRN